MISEVNKRISRALAGIRLAFRGIVGASNTNSQIALIQGHGVNGEQVQWLEHFQQFGFSSAPPAGTMMIVLPLGGKSSHGIVIATENGQYRIKGLEPGETAIFNAFGDKIVLRKGRVIEIDTNILRINATTKVEINSPIVDVVDGDVRANGVSLKHHHHSGVSTGGAQTGEPV